MRSEAEMEMAEMRQKVLQQRLLAIIGKGPSIKDVSSEGEGGGYEKLRIGETLKA